MELLPAALVRHVLRLVLAGEAQHSLTKERLEPATWHGTAQQASYDTKPGAARLETAPSFEAPQNLRRHPGGGGSRSAIRRAARDG